MILQDMQLLYTISYSENLMKFPIKHKTGVSRICFPSLMAAIVLTLFVSQAFLGNSVWAVFQRRFLKKYIQNNVFFHPSPHTLENRFHLSISYINVQHFIFADVNAKTVYFLFTCSTKSILLFTAILYCCLFQND